MDRLQVMRQFVTVAETGSFSAAARRLGVQQPAMSKAIAALEDYLGVRLLVRSSRAHSLTDAGQRFYDRARIALDEADAAEAAAREAATQLTGRLRIAAPSTYASQVLIPHLAAFLDGHPGLAVDLVLDDRRIDLIEEGVDLAIRAGALDDSSLTARVVDQTRRLLVTTPAYLDRHGSPHIPEALHDHLLISYAPFETPKGWRFESPEGAVDVRVDARIVVNSAEGLRAALLAGLGIGLATSRMVGGELTRGELVPLLQAWTLPAVDVWAIFPAGRRPTARARVFADWMTVTLAQNRVQGRDAL